MHTGNLVQTLHSSEVGPFQELRASEQCDNICFCASMSCIKCIYLGYVCFPENTFREIIFQTFLCLFIIKKVGQRKTLSGQWKTLSSQRKIHSG